LGQGDSGVTITSTPRIILVAPSFSPEITTTVLWLNNQGLNIQCVKAQLYNLGDGMYLDIDQVIPLPSASDYQVKLRDKTIKAEQEVKKRRQENTIKILIDNDVLKEGARLHMISLPRAGMTVGSEAARRATFVSTNQIRWDEDNEIYSSLSSLCLKVCTTFGGDPGSRAFPGPDHWAIEGESASLSQRARELLSSGIEMSD